MTPEQRRAALKARKTRALVAAARRPPRLPLQLIPTALERAYTAQLLPYARMTRAAFAPLLAALPALLEQARGRTDESSAGSPLLAVPARDQAAGAAPAAPSDDPLGTRLSRADADGTKRVRELAAAAGRALEAKLRPSELEQLGRRFAKRTSDFQKAQLQKQARRAVGADLFMLDKTIPPLVDGFVKENVALIKDIPRKTAGEIERISVEAVAKGRRHESLAKELEERFGMGENRARLIARDQVGKLYGQVNAARQKEIGIERFVWRSSRDERVRAEHDDRDGETYHYDDPPDGELPGEPIQCRCHAEPVFGDLEF